MKKFFLFVVTFQIACHVYSDTTGINDLPLIELPVSAKGKTLAIIISGDGGWASLDKSLGESFNTKNIPVVGLNSLQYFWTQKSPKQASKDLARIIQHYSEKWLREEVVLVGYSRGADVLPFIVSGLDADAVKNTIAFVFLSPGKQTEFQFHLTDWMSSSTSKNALDIVPEMLKLSPQKVLCVFGSDEMADSACPSLNKETYKVIQVQGGHHYNGDYSAISQLIFNFLNDIQ